MYVTKHGLRRLGICIVAIGAIGAGACSTPAGPGLGEIMTLNQMRHAKLWLAGEAGNWNLADYELDELQEGFDDVVKYHPTHKDSPLPLSDLVPKIMSQPMQSLRQAVGAKDTPGFEKSFDDLTAACNSCHQATDFGFNVVKRPDGSSWFSNQDFRLPP
jgi:hypothetical protein